MTPMAIASDGSVIVNAYQLATKDDLAALIEVAAKSGCPTFVGLVVPARLHPALIHDIDDAVVDVIGRLGPVLLHGGGGRRRLSR